MLLAIKENPWYYRVHLKLVLYSLFREAYSTCYVDLMTCRFKNTVNVKVDVTLTSLEYRNLWCYFVEIMRSFAF